MLFPSEIIAEALKNNSATVVIVLAGPQYSYSPKYFINNNGSFYHNDGNGSVGDSLYWCDVICGLTVNHFFDQRNSNSVLFHCRFLSVLDQHMVRNLCIWLKKWVFVNKKICLTGPTVGNMYGPTYGKQNQQMISASFQSGYPNVFSHNHNHVFSIQGRLSDHHTAPLTAQPMDQATATQSVCSN